MPQNHLAHFIRDLADSLNLRAIEATYMEERGYPPYHPRMRVAVLLCAYCTGLSHEAFGLLIVWAEFPVRSEAWQGRS